MSDAPKPLTGDELQAMLDRSPFIAFLGLKVTEADPAQELVTMTCAMRPEFERGAGTGQWHGGPIAAIIDTVGDYALIMALRRRPADHQLPRRLSPAGDQDVAHHDGARAPRRQERRRRRCRRVQRPEGAGRRRPRHLLDVGRLSPGSAMIRPMLMRLASFALAAVLLPAGIAAAQTMDFACPDPGTGFTYDSGVKVVSRGRDGLDCNMDRIGGKPFKLRALLFDNPSPDGADTSAYIAALRPERLWPLEVGKKIEARYSVGGSTWTYTLSVPRTEKRTGPGDRMIDTFVIEMNEHGDKGQRSISRWWISPADKFAIRYDFSDGAGKANRAVVTEVTR